MPHGTAAWRRAVVKRVAPITPIRISEIRMLGTGTPGANPESVGTKATNPNAP